MTTTMGTLCIKMHEDDAEDMLTFQLTACSLALLQLSLFETINSLLARLHCYNFLLFKSRHRLQGNALVYVLLTCTLEVKQMRR